MEKQLPEGGPGVDWAVLLCSLSDGCCGDRGPASTCCRELGPRWEFGGQSPLTLRSAFFQLPERGSLQE